MISEQTLEQLTTAIANHGLGDNAISQLRQAFAGVRLTFCLLDEMEASLPFREYEGFSLFLVGASDHCLGLTRHLEKAVGVVIAAA
ncbi:hypothetical protein ACFOSS_13960 [Pseudaeromonas sharmana]|uniref:Uncharacterized protein n=1 Tax=Pseudaeromonas sharmana TaxID=328412 RepID=A0ABV8CS00_9GAMM